MDENILYAIFVICITFFLCFGIGMGVYDDIHTITVSDHYSHSFPINK